MKTILIALTLTFAAAMAKGQFSCTPKVSADICKAAESANFVAASQKDLTVVVADPAGFAREKSQLESTESACVQNIRKLLDINRCRGHALSGIDYDTVLLETSPEGRLQKIVISTDYFRGTDKTKSKSITQSDGTTRVEVGLNAEPDTLTTFEKMTQVEFFVLGYNSGQLNYKAR